MLRSIVSRFHGHTERRLGLGGCFHEVNVRTWALASEPAIAAVEELPPGKYEGHDGAGMQELVLRRFLQSHSLGPRDVDGLLVCPSGMASGAGADIFVHERLNDVLGIRPRFCETVTSVGRPTRSCCRGLHLQSAPALQTRCSVSVRGNSPRWGGEAAPTQWRA